MNSYEDLRSRHEAHRAEMPPTPRGEEVYCCDGCDLATDALAEVERTRHHDMYERAYFDVQSVLDGAVGRDAEDGAGGGVAADVALLAQRYADLRAAVLTEVASPSSWWADRVAEIEAAELREDDDLPEPCQPIGCDHGHHLPGCAYASVDCEDRWHSAPGETPPTDPCATCGACGTEG